MRYLIWFLAIISLLIIQSAILTPLGITPINLLLVLVVVSLLFASFDFGLGLALVSGILLDFLSGSRDGIISLSMVSIFLIMYFVINNILSREPNMLVLFSSVGAATIGYYILYLIYSKFFGLADVSVIKTLPLSLFFNLLFCYPILWIHSKLTAALAEK